MVKHSESDSGLLDVRLLDVRLAVIGEDEHGELPANPRSP